MKFPTTYKCLNQNEFKKDNYKIVPLRYEDRMDIMKWRNEQMYHLRQAEPLTQESQENYFLNVISDLFEEDQPNQILFSYLRDGLCIGYGGLVHINWIDRNAEISFVLDTELELNEFDEHWSNYLELLEELAFKELFLHKIFTYAFDLRPILYEVLEKNGYRNEAVLKEHCFFNQTFIDVYIHKKTNFHELKKLEQHHEELLFNWANDQDVRQNALNVEPIKWENHLKWFKSKCNTKNSNIFIFEFNSMPIGQIRIDKIENDSWVIDYSIDKNQRGKGYGYFMIKALIRTLPNYKLRAIVKVENIASIKVFEKLGFKKELNLNMGIVNYYFN